MQADSAKNKQVTQILSEALPYIKRYQGKTIVIKYGGHAMENKALKTRFAKDIILMKLVGMNPVIVHGGGPQINHLLEQIGKESTFIGGMRVTDEKTMDVVEMVLGGQVNKEIVNLINSLGGKAVGITGKDGNLICAKKLMIKNNDENAEQDTIDYGHVGEVEKIDPKLVSLLENEGFIPVIAPVGADEDGQTYNINADLVAGKLAITLRAEKLILLTDIEGVKTKNGLIIQELTRQQTESLIKDGTISGGMIPKVKCAMDAITHGVESAVILDGTVSHALLLEQLTDSGIGTQIKRSG